MASVLQRFKDIMSANINTLLDKAEDPEKMIDQYLRNLESDLGKVKAETAAVMAEEKRAKRQLDDCAQEIDKLQGYAQKAVLAGNDNDAMRFLEKKNELVKNQQVYQQGYELAQSNSLKMREMHDKLVSDISSLNTRKNTIKAKIAVAKTKQTMNKIGASADGARNSLSAFERMEAKADKMLDEANAMSELNAPKKDTIDDLAAKYDSQTTSGEVDSELAALKAQMGL